jgi:hypothetical protein
MKFKLDKCHRGDGALPIAHTCYFTLDLPPYTTKKQMKRQILYAIYHCTAIDGDDTGVGRRSAALEAGWD